MRGYRLAVIAISLFGSFGCNQHSPRESDGSISKDHTRDSLEVCGAVFFKILRNDTLQFLINPGSDTLFQRKEYFSNVEFTDFNLDGCPDIKADIFSREAGACEIFLFDQNNKSYKQLDDVHANPVVIKDSGYYYSYERIGCGGDKWQSFLCGIYEFKSVVIAEMKVESCDLPTSVTVEGLNKVSSRVFLETLDSVTWQSEDDKRSFINDYWMKNYLRIVRKVTSSNKTRI
jgi:hypothetical protein